MGDRVGGGGGGGANLGREYFTRTTIRAEGKTLNFGISRVPPRAKGDV